MSSPALKTATQEAPAQRPHVVPTGTPVPSPAPAAQQPEPKKSSPTRKLIIGAVALVALAVAAKYGYDYATVGRFMVSTDDAYVKADTSVLSTKVAGLVAETPVLNNTPVKAGTVLLRLDTKDYELAIADAKAKIATQQAGIAVIGKQKAAQEAQIASAQAQAQVAKAGELNAVLTQQRTSQMVKSNVGSQQALDDANRARDVAEAGIIQADAGIQAAVAQRAVLDANEVQAQAVLANLNVSLEKAQHDLDSGEIKAPFDGVVANRAVAPGEFVGPGTNLMALVPVQTSFITANFKETQLATLHPGQKVEIDVDAFKGETFQGKVASISPASGAEFSLLPPDNATGNFTKITQRFPVKILLPPELSAKLRPGMSVAVSVDTRDKGEAAN
jgi:membrane fusion protein, multidrug efflux system